MSENSQIDAGDEFRPLCGNLLGCTLDGPQEPAPFVERDVRGRGRPPAQIDDPIRHLTLAEITERIDRMVLGDAEYTPVELADQVRLLVNELRRQGSRVNAYLRMNQ